MLRRTKSGSRLQEAASSSMGSRLQMCIRDSPVFVADLVRNVALKTQSHSAFSWYRVEAENFESIPNHQAYAVIERDLRS